MIRSLFLSTALLGLVGHAATVAAQGAYIDGTYVPAGSSITVPVDGGHQPMLGTVYDSGTAHHAAPAPSTHRTITPAPGTSQSYTLPAGQDATYDIVVPAAPAPVVTYAEPAYVPVAEPAATGWKPRGVYVGARAGVALARDTEFTVAGQGGNPPAYIENAYEDPGYVGSLAVGYQARAPQGWGYRVEVEGGYQTADVDAHRVRNVGTFRGRDALGDTKVLFGFVNVYGDIPVTDRLTLTAGGGAGAGRVEFDDHGLRGPGTALDDSDTAFGYHLDAGVIYRLSDRVELEALYRYQSFVDAELRTENGNVEEIDVDSHNILAGVRVGF